MKRKLTFLFLVTMLTLSCSKNDKNEGEQPNGKELSKSEIIGTWRLEKISINGTVAPADDCQKKTNITFKTDNSLKGEEYYLDKGSVGGCGHFPYYDGHYNFSEKKIMIRDKFGYTHKFKFYTKDNKLITSRVEGRNFIYIKK